MKASVGLNRYAIEDWEEATEFALGAERLGVDSLWSAEAWAHDAATPLAYLIAKTSTLKFGSGIFQVGTRTPSLVAMTAMTLDSMSGGRFILGLGTSGPQVIEGWHGIPFRKPVKHTREIIDICRRIFNGETLAYEGEFWELPLSVERGGTGLGKALRSGAPVCPNLPIYVASLGPKNLFMTGAFADGWLGTSFLPEAAETFLGPMRKGAESAGRTLESVDIAVGGTVRFTEDIEQAAEELKPSMAFQIGAMGSKTQNFYADAYRRQGWADEVSKIQGLWVEGRRDEARREVPTEMVLNSSILGSSADVAEKLKAYKDVGVNTFRIGPYGTSVGERLDTLAETMKILREINLETQI
tara:strand:- start:1271 stop:2338 length:1068 start_codon:yes stop_codon:yes gene_type:complete